MAASTGFHDVLFPLSLGLGARGGPERLTDIVTLGSGQEERNARWASSRRRFDAGSGIKTLDDLHDAIAFFEERRGRLYAFRFRDPLDWRSRRPSEPPSPLDQVLGSGNGAQRTFDLVKAYGGAHAPWHRRITKPVVGSVRAAIDGTEIDPAHFSVDHMAGIVTFGSAQTPPEGAVISAGFAFDIAVRFDTDRLDVDLSAFAAGRLPSIPLIEVL